MNESAFCIARVVEPVESPDGYDDKFVYTELSDANAVVDFLKETYDHFATRLADENSERSKKSRIDLTTIGGFGVQLTNRFGGEIEIGLGRRFGLLIRLEPKPTRINRKPRQDDGTLVFYLDGWHYTEMDISDLVPRDECLACLRKWLDTNEFPNNA